MNAAPLAVNTLEEFISTYQQLSARLSPSISPLCLFPLINAYSALLLEGAVFTSRKLQ